MVSTAGLSLKTKAFIGIMRMRRQQFHLGSTQQDDAYTAKHAQRHGDAKKEIRICIANVLAVRRIQLSLFVGFALIPWGCGQGFLEDLPMGLLGLIYIADNSTELPTGIDLVMLLSTASSFLMVIECIRCGKTA